MRFYTILLGLFFLISPFLGQAQSGCTDSQALNYDANATENDGSCLYPITNYQPILLTGLNNDLEEASGLAYVNGKLWAHNDGGNPDKLFEVDTLSGNVLAEVTLEDATNIDWEDIAQSEDYLYVGDFGNNAGNRNDLKVYRLAKNNLVSESSPTATISFSYEDQTDFSENQNNHNFDCEAFFYHQDSLHLFTKNWLDNTTKHYVLPASLGVHTAKLRATFDTEGLITGADIAPDGTVVLVGYTSGGLTFMWLLYDYQEGDFFSGNKRRIELGSAITNSQLEGVVFSKNAYGYLASESFSILPPKLFAFETKVWTDFTSSVPFLNKAPYSVQLHPNPTLDAITMQFSEYLQGDLSIEIYSSMGKKVGEEEQVLYNTNQVRLEDLASLSEGMYWLLVQHQSYQTVLSFQKLNP